MLKKIFITISSLIIFACTGFAFDAGFDLFAVDRTAALFERTAGLEYGDGEAAVLLKQLIC